MADQSNEMVSRVAAAIDVVQCFSRFNDWASDRVEGFPIEICRYGGDHEEEIVVVRRFPASVDQDAALRSVVSEMRARAAIEAMTKPSEGMLAAIWSMYPEGAESMLTDRHIFEGYVTGIRAALSHDEVKG